MAGSGAQPNAPLARTRLRLTPAPALRGPLLPRQHRQLHDRRPRRGRLRALQRHSPRTAPKLTARVGGNSYTMPLARSPSCALGPRERLGDERLPGHDQPGGRPGFGRARLGGDQGQPGRQRLQGPRQQQVHGQLRIAQRRLRGASPPTSSRSGPIRSHSSGRAARAGRTRSSAARPCSPPAPTIWWPRSASSRTSRTTRTASTPRSSSFASAPRAAARTRPSTAIRPGREPARRDRHRLRAGVRAQPRHGLSEHAGRPVGERAALELRAAGDGRQDRTDQSRG